MYVELADPVYDLILDNVSVKKLQGKCNDNLVHNGNFDNSKYWQRVGGTQYNIEGLSNKHIKVTNRGNNWDGIRQDLYLEKECLQSKQRYHITGKQLFYHI